MLAYVLWHWPVSGVPVGDYEMASADLHAALAAPGRTAAPAFGLLSSVTWQVAAVPWGPPYGRCYADWYLANDFASLEALNEAAVSGSRRGPHDRVAVLSGGGVGGLYRLRTGASDPVAGVEAWFAKPPGWSYPDLDCLLEATFMSDPASSVWQRQLVLGPGLEFCLATRHPDVAAALPEVLNAVTITRNALPTA